MPLPTHVIDDRSYRCDRTAEITTALKELTAPADGAEERRLRDELVTLHLPVAASVARRYRHRGVSEDDLEQVAFLALTLAARRFDAHAGHDFMAFCVPTVRGEIRRYFRDQGWSVRPPRRIQEVQHQVTRAETELNGSLGRSPTPAEVAEHLDVPEEEVIEALAAQGCFTPTSLDRPVGEEGAASIGDLLPSVDAGQDEAEARATLGPAVRTLCDRDRQILGMRFFEGLTQREIAEHLDVTQMQVSRLLTRIFRDIRSQVGDVAPESATPTGSVA